MKVLAALLKWFSYWGPAFVACWLIASVLSKRFHFPVWETNAALLWSVVAWEKLSFHSPGDE